MTQRDLNEEWARTQLEAWADGSLTGETRARMDAAIGADPLLAAAAERAVAVQRALRESAPVSMPRGLRGRLLAIPGQAPRARRPFFLPAFVSAATAAAAVVAVALWLRSEPPTPQVDPQVAAVTQDVETAMRYLQKTASITQRHVTSAVGTGFGDALTVTRGALERSTEQTGGEEI
jgi:anti-sigma factor RsiW